MQKLRALFRGTDFLTEVSLADGFFTRLRGLSFRRDLPPGNGLLLRPCGQIHTFHMRFRIDALYLSREGRVLRVDESLPPRRVRPAVKGCYQVLESPAGACAAAGISAGDRLEFLPARETPRAGTKI